MTRDSARRWNPAFDDRNRIAEATGLDRETVDRVLGELFDLVRTKPVTTIIGTVKFEWRPRRGTTPTGKPFVSRRLRVTLSRYLEAPAKALPVLGSFSEKENTTHG